MNQNNNQNQEQNTNRSQGFYAEPRFFLSRDGEYLTIVLPGNMFVRKHINFYKKLLGVPFTPKAAMENVA